MGEFNGLEMAVSLVILFYESLRPQNTPSLYLFHGTRLVYDEFIDRHTVR